MQIYIGAMQIAQLLHPCFIELSPRQCYTTCMNTLHSSNQHFLFAVPKDFLTAHSHMPLFRPLCLTEIGLFPDAENHFIHRPKGCDTAIFIFCVEGEGTYSVQNQPLQTLRAGEAILIPPDTLHQYGASKSSPWSIYWMHIQGEFMEPFYSTILQYLPVSVSQPHKEALVQLFEQCFTLLKQPIQTEEYFLLCQKTSNILATLLLAGKQAGQLLSPKGEQAIQSALEYMQKYLKGNLTLNDIAKAANFSPSHLNTLFKRSTGTSPVEYFLHSKMQAAAKDLYYTSRSVKDIALEYGMQDPYYFSRLFKRIIGVSPQEYRKQTRS